MVDEGDLTFELSDLRSQDDGYVDPTIVKLL